MAVELHHLNLDKYLHEKVYERGNQTIVSTYNGSTSM